MIKKPGKKHSLQVNNFRWGAEIETWLYDTEFWEWARLWWVYFGYSCRICPGSRADIEPEISQVYSFEFTVLSMRLVLFHVHFVPFDWENYLIKLSLWRCIFRLWIPVFLLMHWHWFASIFTFGYWYCFFFHFCFMGFPWNTGFVSFSQGAAVSLQIFPEFKSTITSLCLIMLTNK